MDMCASSYENESRFNWNLTPIVRNWNLTPIVPINLSQARQQGVMLWNPPTATRHIAALLMLLSSILLAASGVPNNQIKAKLHHPMVLGTKVWALAHLLANGSLADTVLFASFLLWSVVLFAASRRRDRREQTVYPAGTAGITIVTVVAGIAAWAVFAFWLHRVLIGVSPFGAMSS